MDIELGKEKTCKCKEGCLKYAVIFIGTIIGAFLAFYFVADFTIKTMLSPEHQMRKAEKMMRNMDRQISRDMNREIAVVGRMMPNPVNIAEKDNSYILTIALKPFGNNSKNINISVENNNILKIEGSNEIKKGDKENMMNMQQTYLLDRNVDFKKMTKSEDKGKMVVTLPYLE